MAIASGPPGCSLPHVCSTQVNGTAALAGGAGGETSYGESRIQPRTSPAPCVPATGPSAAPPRSQERSNLFISRPTSPSGQGAGRGAGRGRAGAESAADLDCDGPLLPLRGLYLRRAALVAGSPARRGYARACAAQLCLRLWTHIKREQQPVPQLLVRACPFECASPAHSAVRSCLRCAFLFAHPCAAYATGVTTARAPLWSAVANIRSMRAVGSRSAPGRDCATVSGCFELVECCTHVMPDGGHPGKVVVNHYAILFSIPQAKL